MTDLELVLAAQAGDEAAARELLARYSGVVGAACRSFFLRGAEAADLRQWAIYGLLEAIRDFDPGRGETFGGYARTRVRGRVLAAIRSASRRKHEALNVARTVDGVNRDGEAFTLWEQCPGSVHSAAVSRLATAEFLTRARCVLTPLQYGVLVGRLAGETGAETAARLGKNRKSVDNAWQKARAKLLPIARELLVD
jgi:RNA polymerase sporulation-specific sigma factor